MSWSGSGRGGWQRAFWLPLVLGIGIGVLVFGLPHSLSSIWGGGQSDTRGGFAANAPSAQQQEQQLAPQQGQQFAPQAGSGQTAPNAGTTQNAPGTNVAPSAPQRGYGRGHGEMRDGWRGMPRRHAGFGFHFGGLGLLLPLVLIGTGAWLLLGRRRGPGNWGGPVGPQAGQPGTPATPAATPTEPQSGDYPAPPTTGDTRRL